jgi:hypothetical protein
LGHNPQFGPIQADHVVIRVLKEIENQDLSVFAAHTGKSLTGPSEPKPVEDDSIATHARLPCCIARLKAPSNRAMALIDESRSLRGGGRI